MKSRAVCLLAALAWGATSAWDGSAVVLQDGQVLSGALESLNPRILDSFLSLVHDRMTVSLSRVAHHLLETGMKPKPFSIVPLIDEGRDALKKINIEMGLGLDDWDIEYYYNLFVKEIGRNPTNVECFDLGQSNSEHSRHWFFKGRLIIDGAEVPHTVMDIIMQPLKANPVNSVIAFKVIRVLSEVILFRPLFRISLVSRAGFRKKIFLITSSLPL